MAETLWNRLLRWWNGQPRAQICPRCHLYFDGGGRIVDECPDCARVTHYLEFGCE